MKSKLAMILGCLCILIAIPGLAVTASGVYQLFVGPQQQANLFQLTKVFQFSLLVTFIALLGTGFSLLKSYLRRLEKNVVPGFTLYLLGASVCANGMIFFVFGQLLAALLLIVIGISIMWLEYRSIWL